MKSEFALYERAAEAAIKAGEQELVRRFAPDRIAKSSFKDHRELVTKADEASNRAIQNILSDLTPDAAVMSEEGVTSRPTNRPTRRYSWVLDPLDGTTNYTIGLPLWGISLALVKDGVPVRGWITIPLLHERYVAKLHEGAWRNGKKFRLTQKLPMKDGVGLVCHGYREEERAADIGSLPSLMRNSYSTRRLGSAVIELAWVATGRASYLVIYGAKPWDLAAGTLLVTEAGGRVARTDGGEWVLGEGDMVAANPAAFREVMEAIKSK